MSKSLIILACFIAFMLLPVSFAHAMETQWADSEQVRARLLTGVESAGEKDFEALLHLQLAEGWHTYWHHPGDAGLPPRFDWSGSENIEGVDISWPAPIRKQELDFYTLAYDGDVQMPLLVKIKEPGKAVKLHLKLAVMVCKDICIPQNLELVLNIPAGVGEVSSKQALIDAAKL
jgi:suppressor for copper-sensitivity B